METDIYLWTDRQARAYATLRQRGHHWRAEWGYRDPPGTDSYLPQGRHETSVREEAVCWMLDHVRALSTEPGEVERVERRLREALASAEG
ncbi:MAG: hypothetical protein HY691_16040 [Chloroflexi bacterium]|nr:hypothetical protein [Chloroflexota bacterium]